MSTGLIKALPLHDTILRHFVNLSLTYSLRHSPLTYSPGPHGATFMDKLKISVHTQSTGVRFVSARLVYIASPLVVANNDVHQLQSTPLTTLNLTMVVEYH